MRSTSSWALSVDPIRCPLLDSEDTFSNAVTQFAIPLSLMTSEGEKDNNSDDASVLRSDDDPSCLAATVTSAWQREDLSRVRFRCSEGESNTEIEGE